MFRLQIYLQHFKKKFPFNLFFQICDNETLLRNILLYLLVFKVKPNNILLFTKELKEKTLKTHECVFVVVGGGVEKEILNFTSHVYYDIDLKQGIINLLNKKIRKKRQQNL